MMVPPAELLSPVLLVPTAAKGSPLFPPNGIGWRTVMDQSSRMFPRERASLPFLLLAAPQARSQSSQFESRVRNRGGHGPTASWQKRIRLIRVIRYLAVNHNRIVHVALPSLAPPAGFILSHFLMIAIS
jgi:hypothetical protein